MHIHEAVKKAVEEDKLIARKAFAGSDDDVYAAIRVSNSYETCRIVVIDGNQITRTCRCWNPSQDDLTADDWIVIPEYIVTDRNHPYFGGQPY